MEQKNHVSIIGMVGCARLNNLGNTRHLEFTVCTNLIYKDRSGAACIETTWHQVSAFESSKCSELDKIQKGSNVSIEGRLRYKRYTGEDGKERTLMTIEATSVILLNDETLIMEERDKEKTVILYDEECNVLEKIAARSKMDEWFNINERNEISAEDVRSLIEGLTEYDTGTLRPGEIVTLTNLLIRI